MREERKRNRSGRGVHGEVVHIMTFAYFVDHNTCSWQCCDKRKRRRSILLCYYYIGIIRIPKRLEREFFFLKYKLYR